MSNQQRAERNAEENAGDDPRNEPETGDREQAGVGIRHGGHRRLSKANHAQSGAKVLLREALVVEHDGQRRAGNRGDGIEHAKTATKHQAHGPLRFDRTAVTGSLQQDQRQQRDECQKAHPPGMHLRHDHGPDNHPRHQSDDHWQHAPPHAAERVAVVPQHVRVQHDLDQHQRRIENAVGQEEQRKRNGNRREAVTERAVDDGRAKGNKSERELQRVHTLCSAGP
jgi:hypothetical protein